MPNKDQTYLAQVVLPAASGIAKDNVVNTYHFLIPGGADFTAKHATLTSNLHDFYQTLHGGFSTAINMAGITVKWYWLADTPPRVPRATDAMASVMTGTDAGGPAETAICISWAADYVSGTPAARCRGRNYYGPLAAATCNTPTIGAATLSGWASAASALLGAFHATLDSVSGAFVVYSKVDQTSRPVTRGWIDNAWDTQRRRGVKATSKTPFT